MTLRSALPQELHELIISQLSDDDFRTLQTCSLVCFAWLAPTRIRFFHSVSLTQNNANSFLEVLESRLCTFAHFVQSLEIVLFSHGQLGTMMTQLRTSLKRIKHLCIKNIFWKWRDRLGSIPPVSGGFESVETLDLVDGSWESLDILARFVCSFPVLRHLGCNGIYVQANDEPAASVSRQFIHPSTITSLSLGSTYYSLLCHFTFQPIVRHLRSFELSIQRCLMSTACELLRAMGSLRHLVLATAFENDYRKLTLMHNTALETLSVFISGRGSSLDCIPDLISSSTSPHLYRLTFELEGCPLELLKTWPRTEFLRFALASRLQVIVFITRSDLPTFPEILHQVLCEMMSGLDGKIVMKFETKPLQKYSRLNADLLQKYLDYMTGKV